MAAYFFASPVDVDVKLEGEEIRKQVEVKQEKERTVSCPVYYDGDSVGGTVCPFVPHCLNLHIGTQ
jgi:vacuolar protein sorting-associated protein 26